MTSITSALAIDPTQFSLDPARAIMPSSGSASAREVAQHMAATTGPAVNAKDVGQQFEAMYLRQMFDSMMPQDSGELFGGGTAGTMWRSMMVDSLATALSKAGTIGIAKMVDKAHPANTKDKA